MKPRNLTYFSKRIDKIIEKWAYGSRSRPDNDHPTSNAQDSVQPEMKTINRAAARVSGMYATEQTKGGEAERMSCCRADVFLHNA